MDGTSVNDFGLIQWLTSNDGIFNPKQALRYDLDSHLGIFAKESIKKDELLVRIPANLIFGFAPEKDDDEEEDDDDDDDEEEEGYPFCELVVGLADELELGADSFYGPYMGYLSSILETGPTVPSAWSDVGQMMLSNLVNGEEEEIPPDNTAHLWNLVWLPPGESVLQQSDISWFDEWCRDNIDLRPLASLVSQRALAGDFLVPIYDLFTHRNDPYCNVKTKFEEDGQHVRVVALRAIDAGEQLHISYDQVEESDPGMEEETSLGTLEIFRDYGIVERYPQRFSIQWQYTQVFDDEIPYSFSVMSIDFEVLKDNDGVVSVDWDEYIEFGIEGRRFIRTLFRKELQRLLRVGNIEFEISSGEAPSGLSRNEWDTIRNIYDTMTTAMQYAIQSITDPHNEGGFDNKLSVYDAGSAGSNGLLEIHYDDFRDEKDYIDYVFEGCELSELVDFAGYKQLYVQDTNYQHILFAKREEDGDVCLHLDDVLQICSNYRPHYHEFFAHFASRYIEKIERVVIIGGGDAMMLHEVLKFPSLKKVVGLELDQQVTRKSFKYFRTQPHFDNEKVEWWYGDATKSLPLLPRNYWGSFDLILVDVSETVMSMTVTTDLDIFAALSFLLKPTGVMVKNEDYLLPMTQVFGHSLTIFYGSPKVCTQVLSLASNNVDFLHDAVSEKNAVERLLVEKLDEDETRFKYMHSYRRKTQDGTEKDTCQSGNDEDAIKDVRYGKTAGILEIIDAENTSAPLDESNLEQKLRALILQQGLSIVSHHPISENGTFVFVLKEGYIVVRSWPDKRYCAIDLHLWGAFQKRENIRQALIEAVGSTSPSSFRIVVGGMHGTSTWDEDKEEIGIRIYAQAKNCDTRINSEEEIISRGLVSVELKTALSDLVDDVFPVDGVVLVVCGLEGKEECVSAKALSTNRQVRQVVPIWTCPSLDEGVDYTQNPDEMYKCERLIHQMLEEAFGAEESSIDAFVLDNTASYGMVQVILSLLSLSSNRKKWFAPHHVMVAPVLTASESKWRHNFMDRLRTYSHPFPVYRAVIDIRRRGEESSNSSFLLSLGLFVSNEPSFFTKLTKFEADLQQSLSNHHGDAIEIEISTVMGGVEYYDSEYKNTGFDPDAYDPAPALEQASAQLPLGRQSVFQFEASHLEEDGDTSNALDLDTISASLETVFDKLGYIPSKLNRYTEVGDGGVVVSTFSDDKGVLLMVWDGQSHVDINLFSCDQSAHRADAFSKTFETVSGMHKTLRDDQPRGTGRVIQFQSEI